MRAREADIAECAKLVLADAREAERLRPQDWPETRRITEAYSRATRNPRPLSELQRDSGLRAVLVLFAAGYSVADVEWVAANVPTQAWWRGGGSAFEGLAAFRSRSWRERWRSALGLGVWWLQRARARRTARTGGFIAIRCSRTRKLVDMAPRSVLAHAVGHTFVNSWTILNGGKRLATSKSSRYRGKQVDGRGRRERSPERIVQAPYAQILGSQLPVFFAESAWREFWRKFGASCGGEA